MTTESVGQLDVDAARAGFPRIVGAAVAIGA